MTMRLVLLILLVTLSYLGDPSDAEAKNPKVDVVGEQARVRMAIDQFYNAAKAQDWDLIAEMLTDDFEIYTDGSSSYSKQAYLDVLTADDLELEEMQLKDLEIRISEDGKMAWTKYRGRFKHGVTVETVETLIFIHQADGWKINHAHASVKMLDVPSEEVVGETTYPASEKSIAYQETLALQANLACGLSPLALP